MPVDILQDRVVLRHPKGSSAEVLFYGATVISWKSGSLKDTSPVERLFVSSKASLDGSKPVRGGIPVVFPCFGPPSHPDHAKLSQHGFARSETWTWNAIVMDNEAALDPTEKIRGLYSRPVHLAYVVTLAEHQLSTDIHVSNKSTSSPDTVEFQALFHNYIRAPANDVVVSPLQNLSYYDKTEATEEGRATAKVESRAEVDVKKITDSVYENAAEDYEVTYPGAVIGIRSRNLKDVVVWNPQEGGQKIGDMEEQGWERIFGSSSAGVKTCLYIHQVYPYFFIEYHGKLTATHVDRYISKLTKSLNHAIALSFKRDPSLPNARRYVRAILLVKDPAHVHRAAAILQSGVVMDNRFSVFENHLSFVLQFMCDFGLYGCGWIEVEKALQRDTQSNMEGDYSCLNSSDQSFERSPYLRQTRMPLEVDVIAPNIMNRRNISARNIHHRLRIPAEPLPDEPLVLSVRELWEDERNRRVVHGLAPTPTIPLDPSDSTRGLGRDWVAEAEYWDRVRERIEADRQSQPALQLFATNGWDNWVMTTFESVEALWEDRYQVWKPARQPPQEPVQGQEDGDDPSKDVTQPRWDASENKLDQADAENIDVDLSKLSSQEFIHLIDQAETWEELAEEDVHAEAEENQDELQSDEVPGDNDDELPDEISEQPPHETGVEDLSNDISRSSLSIDPFKAPDPLHPLSAEDYDYRLSSYPTETFTHRPPRQPEPALTQRQRRMQLTSNELLSPPGRYFPSPSPALIVCQRPSSETTARKFFRETYSIVPTVDTNLFEYSVAAPAISKLYETLDEHGLQAHIYKPPHYSSSPDVPERPKEYAGLVFKLKGGHGITHIDSWEDDGEELDGTWLSSEGVAGWEYASAPPSAKETQKWLAESMNAYSRSKKSSQIRGTTQTNLYGFKESLGPKVIAQTSRERQTMNVFALELYAPTSDNMTPNPKDDAIFALFFAYQNSKGDPYRGIILVENKLHDRGPNLGGVEIEVVNSEIDLVNKVIDVVGDLDPDILLGWDVQRSSWGYLNARAEHHGFDLRELLSRAPPKHVARSDQWEIRHTSTFQVAGRHVLNTWRLMRSEYNLTRYSLENVVFHDSVVLKCYFLKRTSILLDILDACDLVTKTAEFARVFGVDFFSVLSRGSQFKVESFMFRIAKPESFVLISPSRQDVGKQNAAECMPLIMEPTSSFYSSPLVVLDFQSLYPSLMIAYNYCYSTCLGRVTDFQGRNKLGVVDLNLPPGLLSSLADHIQGNYKKRPYRPFKVAPNGILFVKSDVRKGLLGRMLTELLGTRVMVKQAMKRVKDDKALRRVLDARQLGLKYIANVTYGYTSATFSGRMPAVEIADSIVQSGRETLEKARQDISTVVSMLIRGSPGDNVNKFHKKMGRGGGSLRGKTKEQAFRIGQDISDTITALNPAPIKLKFEKVFLPCVLMAKKRYVGFKYENVDDVEAAFDAKGIETVRRDGIPAQQKMVEDSSDQGPPPPGVVVATRRMMEDPASEPQYGDRIPYVIVRGLPGTRLVDRAMDPLEMLYDSRIQLDAVYYITRVLIPPLERIFNLVGADVRSWFDEMPKPQYLNPTSSPSKARTMDETDDRLNLEEHFCSSQCLICGDSALQETIAILRERVQASEKRIKNAHQICATCCNSAPNEPIYCESLDCSWMFSRKREQNKNGFLEIVKEVIDDLCENVDSNEDDEEVDTSDESGESDHFSSADFVFQTPVFET
ncbi:hypothetical protein H0H93_002946 [Arthromyces matolae]|nr:hypothetical protein H0H93_002946 [Arthromyces matolae]